MSYVHLLEASLKVQVHPRWLPRDCYRPDKIFQSSTKAGKFETFTMYIFLRIKPTMNYRQQRVENTSTGAGTHNWLPPLHNTEPAVPSFLVWNWNHLTCKEKGVRQHGISKKAKCHNQI